MKGMCGTKRLVCFALSGLPFLTACVPGALAEADLFRPFRADVLRSWIPRATLHGFAVALCPGLICSGPFEATTMIEPDELENTLVRITVTLRLS